MAKTHFSEPVKRIFDESDLEPFQRSTAYQKLHSAIAFMVEKVKGAELPSGYLDPTIVTKKDEPGADSVAKSTQKEPMPMSKNTQQVLEILDTFNGLIDDTPPLTGPRRFGNMACRDWHKKVNAVSLSKVNKLTTNSALAAELNYYLVNSFGSELRLDYGSGHELSFVAFLSGLFENSILSIDIVPKELLALFARYYDVVRRLILDYNLEPAGSHGVWGLDDHFHFIYILGASQFNMPKDSEVSSRYIPPVSQILSPHVIASYKLSNLYVNAIAFIFKLKSGPFNEHSPILFDIHKSVTLWAKVQSGLLKMYEVEVFSKFPVVQHFWFGSGLFPWTDAKTSRELPTKQRESSNSPQQSTSNIKGLVNGFEGTRTTKDNIALTGAPWARQGAPSGRLLPKKTGSSLNSQQRP